MISLKETTIKNDLYVVDTKTKRKLITQMNQAYDRFIYHCKHQFETVW